jgi:hypothetical protein
VREAARLLCDAGVKPNGYVTEWFGVGDAEEPRPGRLFFSDLRPVALHASEWKRRDLDERGPLDPNGVRLASDAPEVPTQFHRRRFSELSGRDVPRIDRISSTAIDANGTAAEHTLRVIESQPRGLQLRWVARIETQAPCARQLEELAQFLHICAARVESFGALKGSGFGIVRDLEFDYCIVETAAAPALDADKAHESELGGLRHVDLVLFPLEPVYVLDRKIPGSHFLTGPGWITGAVIKGALAAALNREAGSSASTAISAGHPAAKSYPLLTRYFGAIRCLHALPLPEEWSAAASSRPHPVPLSAFADGKAAVRVWDAALSWQDEEPAPGVAVASFAPDCGELSGLLTEPGESGAALDAYRCAKGIDVRTAIDEDRLAAADEQLFGYDYIADACDDGRGAAVRQAFATGFDLPDDGEGLGDALVQEIGSLLADARLGKTGAAAAWRAWQPQGPSLAERLAAYGDEPVVLLLRTDTMLPLSSDQIHGMTDMTPLYGEAWSRIWAHLAAESGAASMPPDRLGITEVFARQGLRGGWIGRHGSGYSVFHITLAGSVFVTGTSAARVLADPAMMACLDGLEQRGAPVLNTNLTPFSCPYFPENGFGEVLVCPPWHLKRKAGH